MNNFTEELVDSLANKLLIKLTREENKMVVDEFNAIDEALSYVEAIPNIKDVEPMTHTLDDFSFSLREDEIEPSIKIEDALSNADRVMDREIEVPKVVGE